MNKFSRFNVNPNNYYFSRLKFFTNYLNETNFQIH